jgi:hypoxanthine phosphoribosyltransferase
MEPAAFAEAAAQLADTIANLRVDADAVLGIARGGQELADRLGGTLTLPVHQLRAWHNRGDGIYQPGTGTVAIDAGMLRFRRGVRLLVADDICGTGGTLTAVRQHLATAHDARVVFAGTLCRNEGNTVYPRRLGVERPRLGRVPWEPHEPGLRTSPLPAPCAVQTAAERRPAGGGT